MSQSIDDSSNDLQAPRVLGAWELSFMAFSAGLSVASIYYNQPLLESMRETFSASAVEAGWIPTTTQLGYAAGMLLFIPMGDLFERVRLMQIFNTLAALALLVIAVAPGLSTLLVGSFAVGLTSMTPQILLPYTSNHVEASRRGQALGMVLSGLLLGILLARTVSGFLGALLGWRGMFAVAALAILPLGYFLGRWLPRSQPQFTGTYKSLLFSLGKVARDQPILREAAFVGACLFAAFSAFWSTLIFFLAEAPFHWGMRAAGLFGLLGAAGALGAPLAGRFADRRDPRLIVGFGLGLAVAAFALMAAAPGSLVALIIAILLLDLGVQAAHVANQSRIFALSQETRSRINTVYMFSYFMGGAFGSSSAAWAWGHYGWRGVCALASAALSIGGVRLAFAAYASPKSGA